MGMFDQVPGLAGYQQQVQLNQQQDAGQMSRLAQLLGIQKDSMQMQVQQAQIDRDKQVRDKLQARALSASGQPQAGGGASGSIFGGQPGAGMKGGIAAQLLDTADIHERAGNFDNAIKLREQAAKLMPEVKEISTEMQNGQPVRVMTMKDGTQTVTQFGAKPEIHWADTGGAIQPMNNLTGQPLVGGSVMQKVQTPDSIASGQVTMRGQNMVDARKREELQGAETAFSPEAIKNAAARYNIDGTLPPMGMGKAGSMGRSAILNEAAIQAQGVNPDDQRINQIGNKANTAALSKLQQQQTMVGAFEKNFVRNADMALDLSKKTSIDGVPLASKWIQAGKRQIAGDPDISAFDVAIKATANEYTKIISGSMGNTAMAEGEIKKVESLLNAAQTPAQVQAVISFMKQETQNRMKGFDEEKAALRGSMGRTPAASDLGPIGSRTAAPSTPTSDAGGFKIIGVR